MDVLEMDVLSIINQTGWNWSMGRNTITIQPPDQEAADYLLEQSVEDLARSAAKVGGTIQLDWGGNFTYKVTSNLASVAIQSQPEPEPKATVNNLIHAVYLGQLHLPPTLLSKVNEMAEDERPCCLIRVRDKTQIGVNEPMVQLLETPADDCVRRIMTGYWRPRDLEYVEQQYRELGRFTWQYDAAINPAAWANLEAYFERFQDENGEWYSFNRNLYHEKVPFPADVAVPL